MKRKNQKKLSIKTSRRRGSTLLIVLALLGLLTFMGIVFFTFAAQEKAAADFFSEAAKTHVNSPDDPFPWLLQQIITGADNSQKNSILWEPRRRHALLTGAMGYDAVPFSGVGVKVIASPAGLPALDLDHDGIADAPVAPVQDAINFVGSMAAWGGAINEQTLLNARGLQAANPALFPEPDVDYTYPDINNILLAHKGWAIRDNGTAAPPGTRYERIPVIIPSGMRPALLKSGNVNGFGGFNTPADVDWFDHSGGAHPLYAVRSLRPSESHIVGYDGGDVAIRRFLDNNNPLDSALVATHGPFPLRPNEDVNPATFGQLGLHTGHIPGTVTAPLNFRLDQDNDGDGVFEGIWMDAGYPAQQTAGGVLYSTIFSFTMYDLDPLIDLNSHGNLAELLRTERLIPYQVGGGAGGSTPMTTTPLSASDQALGPHEVSPIWALTPTAAARSTNGAFSTWYGAVPSNRLEQANMELIWLLTGRIAPGNVVFDGRWGDANALWYHAHGSDGAGGAPGLFAVSSLPRPGRAGDLATASTNLINFGGFQGYDDNGNALEGIASTSTGVLRGFRHPIDIGGTGRSTLPLDPRVPNLFQDNATPERWLRYNNYSLVGSAATVLNERSYLSGRDQAMGNPANDMYINPRFNLGFDDPTECLNDHDSPVRPDDAIFSYGDLVPLHLSLTDIGATTTNLSTRLSNLAVAAFAPGSNISDRFTTVSNSLKSIPHKHDLGANFISNGGGVDDGPRWWEFSADTDNDGRLEFPPRFGVPGAFVPPYRPYRQGPPVVQADPFRPVVRRLLTSEAGEPRQLISQLPLSINHILDVHRTTDTPAENTPEFLQYIQRTGMRFRPLTEHPLATETNGAGNTFASNMTTVPQYGTAAGIAALANFPPRTFEHREFWARRDRQQLARDIYVLLYTVGAAQMSSGNIENPTVSNAGQAIYSYAEMRRMAQFAVNMVDAMDTDDVVTMFEYDKDLGDGWGVDDDPLTENPALSNGAESEDGMYPLDSDTRGVVFGVEAQQLSLSESLAVRFEDFAKYPSTTDNPTTLFNDSSSATPLADPDNDRRDRYVLHLEIQNNQPSPVPLSVNGITGTVDGHNAIWQLARVDRNIPSTDPQATTLTPVGDPTAEDGTTMNFMDGNPNIGGGGRFSVTMATTSNTAVTDAARTDPLGTGNADIYLQKPTLTDYALISPDDTSAGTVAGAGIVAPRGSLDTIHTAHDSRYVYDQNNTDKGHFLRSIPYVSGGRSYNGNDEYNGFNQAQIDAPGGVGTGQGFEVVLRRRMNPNAPLLPLTENPWVEVDRMRVEFKDFFNISGTMATPSFTQITSDERVEPLSATAVVNTSHPAATALPSDDHRYNTIANAADQTQGVNDASAAAFNIWQPHFDRDFTSVVELFHLPIVGPRLLTQRLDRMRYSPAQQAALDPTAAIVAATPGIPALIGSAVGMFLQPDILPVGNDANDNAWYRLLQFIEVPSRVNTMLGEYLSRRRLPGKVNLNGIRHLEVYAGLIDDALLADVPLLNVPGFAGGGNDVDNQYAPFMNSSSSPIPYNPGAAPRAVADTGVTAASVTLPGYRDRWIEFREERDSVSLAHDPIQAAVTNFWIPGALNAKPFRSLGSRRNGATVAAGDNNIDQTILRRSALDVGDGNDSTNRHWLELGSGAMHQNPPATAATAAVSQRERHQVLAKLLNNTTTVSNTFVIYATAAYFKSVADASGHIRVGGRFGLDLDGNSIETDDAGWEQRAVFVVDRTELLNAYDEGTGSFDWRRLIKYRADLASDGN